MRAFGGMLAVIVAAGVLGGVLIAAVVRHEHRVERAEAYRRVGATCGPQKLVVFRRAMDGLQASFVLDESVRWARLCAVGPDTR